MISLLKSAFMINSFTPSPSSQQTKSDDHPHHSCLPSSTDCAISAPSNDSSSISSNPTNFGYLPETSSSTQSQKQTHDFTPLDDIGFTIDILPSKSTGNNNEHVSISLPVRIMLSAGRKWNRYVESGDWRRQEGKGKGKDTIAESVNRTSHGIRVTSKDLKTMVNLMSIAVDRLGLVLPPLIKFPLDLFNLHYIWSPRPESDTSSISGSLEGPQKGIVVIIRHSSASITIHMNPDNTVGVGMARSPCELDIHLSQSSIRLSSRP
ncbi:hypothetical protein V866_006552 [Kwoniella sp. B9012]